MLEVHLDHQVIVAHVLCFRCWTCGGGEKREKQRSAFLAEAAVKVLIEVDDDGGGGTDAFCYH